MLLVTAYARVISAHLLSYWTYWSCIIQQRCTTKSFSSPQEICIWLSDTIITAIHLFPWFSWLCLKKQQLRTSSLISFLCATGCQTALFCYEEQIIRRHQCTCTINPCFRDPLVHMQNNLPVWTKQVLMRKRKAGVYALSANEKNYVEYLMRRLNTMLNHKEHICRELKKDEANSN